MRQRLRVLWPWLAGAVAVVALAGFVLVLLGPATWLVAGSTVRGIPDPKARADAISTVRGFVLTAAAGAVAVVALYFTARNFYLSRRTYQLSVRGQVTDRYSKAVALLASDKAAERVGGVYAFEHVLRESPIDHTTIVDVLAAFVRDRALRPTAPSARSDPPGDQRAGQLADALADALVDAAPASGSAPAARRQRPPADVQAALTVLGRRPDRPEPNPLDLRGTDLLGADLRGARLTGALLTESNLQGADLSKVQLQGAHLVKAQLQGAYLAEAQLQGALLFEADLLGANLFRAQLQDAGLSTAELRGANLVRAQLQGAHLIKAELQDADLTEAQLQRAQMDRANLQGASLVEAQLQGANLHGAELQDVNLSGADLSGADLSGADLRTVHGLDEQQVVAALWASSSPPLLYEERRGWLAGRPASDE